MLVLVLDTATPAITAGIADITPEGVSVLAEKVTVDSRRHAEVLTPALAACLATVGVPATGLAAVVAGVGPGPYTGLRVGLVTAVAFADAAGIPTYGVATLDAVAWEAPPGDGPLLVATDARRREVYWAVYQDGVRTHGPAVDRPADLPVTAPRAAGIGVDGYDLGVPVAQARPSVAALAALAADRIRAKAPAEPLTPLYLRRPDAAEPGARKPVLR